MSRKRPGRPVVTRGAKTLSLSLPPRVVDVLEYAGRTEGKVAARVAAELVIQAVSEMPAPPSEWSCEDNGHCHHPVGQDPGAQVRGPGQRSRRLQIYRCCECGDTLDLLQASRGGTHGPRLGVAS